jgi:hypothetical protein
MQQVNLPRHVVEALEKKWAERLQRQVSAWRTTKSPVQSRTASGVPVERRPRRPRLATTAASAL